jgi:ribosomal protein RSM22 (predicted rRNA methylase)
MSYSERPGELDNAIATWMQNQPGAALRSHAEKLSEAYRHGKSSSHINIAAYLTARMPATFAAIARVLNEVKFVAPRFNPTSVLDVGAGPGTASWAALATWPNLAQVLMIEADARFAALASHLAQHSALPALEKANITTARMGAFSGRADIIIAAYVFAEQEERASGEAALNLWNQCNNTLVIIEPGTPQGFTRIKNARAALLAAGAHIMGPCTHANACPMAGKNWCHFTQRLARSREHMHAKAATVPFEDEPFSWIAVSKEKVNLAYARIIAPPTTTKIATTLRTCDANGLNTQTIASRNKQAYKQAKKLEWGHTLHSTVD